MEGAARMGAGGWADLPDGLVLSILDRLPPADRIRCGAVCVSWCLTTKQKLHLSTPRQTPWLMLSPEDTGDAQGFYSLSEKKTYRIDLPQLRGRRCIGSGMGYLIYADERAELQILNPLTGHQVSLPSITTLPYVLPLYDDKGCIKDYFLDPVTYPLEETCRSFWKKAIVFPSPPPPSLPPPVPIIENCMVGLILGLLDVTFLAIARVGDEAWTLLDTNNDCYIHGAKFTDVIFYKGRLYAVNSYGIVVTCDVAAPSPTLTILTHEIIHSAKFSNIYLAELSGDLLLVLRYDSIYQYDYHYQGVEGAVDDGYRTVKFQLLRPDVHGKSKPLWEQEKSLGDYSIFLGSNHSLCLSILENSELKANCVYFTDNDTERYGVATMAYYDMGIYNLEDGSIELYSPRDTHVWPPAVWFTPVMT